LEMVYPEASGAGLHSHHWMIDEAEAPVSKGVCRHCGTVREFKNERRPGELSQSDESPRRVPGRGPR